MGICNVLDLFRTPVILKFEKKEKSSTNLGGFLSIGIIIFLLIMFAQSDVFHKMSPKIVDLDISSATRSPIQYSNQVFAFSICDSQGTAYIDPQIYSFNVSNYFFQYDPNGNVFVNNNISYALHICTPDDFPGDLYDSLGLHNNYCLNDSNFELSGFWNENQVSFFEVDANLCDNVSTANSCKSIEEIQNFFSGKYFNIYYANLNFDPTNYLTPLSAATQNDVYLIDLNLRKQLNIFLKTIQVVTDDAYIFDNNNVLEGSLLDSKELDMFIDQNISDTSVPLFQCDFYASQNTQKISRVYQKLAEALASIGGIANVVMIIGFVLTSVENGLNLKKRVMNCLYSFQDTQKINKKKNSNKKRDKSYGERWSKTETDSKIKKPHMELSSNLNPDKKTLNPKKKDQKSTNFIKRIITNEDKGEEEKQKDEPFKLDCLSPGYLVPKMLPKETEIYPESKDVLTESKEPKKQPLFPDISESPLKSELKLNNNQLEKIKALEKFEEFKKESSQKSIMNFNIFEYFRLNFRNFFKIKLSPKEKLFLKGEEIYDNELDIIYILKKLQEVEKLKIILFNNEQMTLFHLLDKPMIYMEEGEGDFEEDLEGNRNPSKKMSEILNKTKGVSRERLRQVLSYFNNLDSNSQMNEIDKRLVNLVDKNLANFTKNLKN